MHETRRVYSKILKKLETIMPPEKSLANTGTPMFRNTYDIY